MCVCTEDSRHMYIQYTADSMTRSPNGSSQHLRIRHVNVVVSHWSPEAGNPGRLSQKVGAKVVPMTWILHGKMLIIPSGYDSHSHGIEVYQLKMGGSFHGYVSHNQMVHDNVNDNPLELGGKHHLS